MLSKPTKVHSTPANNQGHLSLDYFNPQINLFLITPPRPRYSTFYDLSATSVLAETALNQRTIEVAPDKQITNNGWKRPQ